MTRVRCLVALLALTLPPVARADERLDHRGALGLVIAPGLEYAALSFAPGESIHDAVGLVVEVDPTFGLGSDGNELVLRLRVTQGSPGGVGFGIGAAYRAYFGRDEWKTYFQLGLKADTAPHLAVGPAADFGLMYELSPAIGFFLQPGLSVEFGRGVRFGAGALVGIQGRTYVLEQ